MPGVTPKFTDEPITYAVSAIVAGGQLVSADQTVSTAPTVKPSAAGDKVVVGVALFDAAPAGTDAATDAAARPSDVAVARECVIKVTFAAASKFGDKLKAADSGQVTPWVDGTDTDPTLIIGQTRDASVAGGDVGLAEISC